jgi:peptide/nickel transport system substrate-binding protein
MGPMGTKPPGKAAAGKIACPTQCWGIVLAVLLAGLPGFAETRPHYGGVLRVEIRESIETPDPPQSGPGLADLSTAFTITRWEAGTEATFAADENAPGGRPFLDGVDVRMGRPLHDQSISLELGRADIVELGLADLRRQSPGRKIWTSSPVRVIALVFAPRAGDARVREALALAVDRAAILNVLLQRQGEISGALLPQWLSGYAFVFPAAQDLPRARVLAAGSRPLTLGVDDPALRPIADRIALNARDAGLTVTVTPQNPNADVRLAEARVLSQDPVRALAGLAAAFGLPAPTPDADTVYDAEHALLEGHRVIPLFHLPVIYGVSPRVKGGPGISPLGEWRFEDLWLEGPRP